jgi:LmbE family N-acetylglucosaminyl deacetylase
MDQPLYVMIIGAHPDDNELNCGGLTARLTARGHKVRYVSVTNGDKGHFAGEYIDNPALLAERRHIEATKAAASVGADYICLNIHDGEVYVDKTTTDAIIRTIRRFGEPGKGPDLVIFNRTVDYHRDHRYTAQLVVDATYMLTVPMMCPDTPFLTRMPVFAHWFDVFTEHGAFVPEIAVPIDDVFEQKVAAVDCHVSQLYEWLPYNSNQLDDVPADPEERRLRLRDHLLARAAIRTGASRTARLHGDTDAVSVEAYRICEYGRRPSDDELRVLFTIDR